MKAALVPSLAGRARNEDGEREDPEHPFEDPP